MGKLLTCQSLFGQFDKLYFISELSVRLTFRSLNLVQTIQQTMICLTDWGASFSPNFVAQTVHKHTCTRTHTCSFIGCQNKYSGSANWTRPKWSYLRIKLALAYCPSAAKSLCNGRHSCVMCSLYLAVFVCWVPQTMLPLPQVHKWDHFLGSETLKTFMPSPMVCCPSFFLFHRRALGFEPIRCKGRQTQWIVPRVCRAKRFGPRTQLCCRSLNCLNQVHEVKSSPNWEQTKFTKLFFRFAEHPKLGLWSKSLPN